MFYSEKVSSIEIGKHEAYFRPLRSYPSFEVKYFVCADRCNKLWIRGEWKSSINCPLQWRHNERNDVSNHHPHDCILNRLFKAQIKENTKAPRYWPLRGEFTGERWIPLTKDQ